MEKSNFGDKKGEFDSSRFDSSREGTSLTMEMGEFYVGKGRIW